jgi:hypothetical protein
MNKQKDSGNCINKVYEDSELKIKALSVDDVANELHNLTKVPTKMVNELFQTYGNVLNSILATALKQATDETESVEIEQLRRLISLCPLEERFIRTKDKVWAVRKHILNKNSKFFLEKDYSKIIKRDANQAFIESMMEIIRDKFTTLSLKDQDVYWQKSVVMLNCVARYKKFISKYNNNVIS